METITRPDRAFRRVVGAAIIAAAVTILLGCGTINTKQTLKTKSETELAVSEIKSEWLKRCEGPAGAMPENQTGALLQDYADMASALAECIKRHNSFVDYMEPIVKKERGQ